MMKRVIKGLRNHPQAKIRFPNNNEMEDYARLINIREPTIDDVIGFLDGVSIAVQCSDYPTMQNAYFNGYHQDTMVNNIFLFSPYGKILFGCFNAQEAGMTVQWLIHSLSLLLIGWEITIYVLTKDLKGADLYSTNLLVHFQLIKDGNCPLF
jgi:hypothetical protein